MTDLSDRPDAPEKEIKKLQLELEELKEENSRLTRLYDKLPISYQSLDENGDLITVNDAWLNHFGYSRNEVIGQHFSKFLSEKSKNVFNTKFPYFKEVGEVSDVPIDLIKKNGEKSSVLFAGQIGKDTNGYFQQTYCVFYDVSEVRRAEKQLKESHERLLLVLDSVDASVYVSTLDTYEILFMNRYMRRLFGEDKVGLRCWDVFRGESGPCEHCTNEQLFDADGKPGEVFAWHDRNPVLEKWFINHDRAIEWIDGQLVKLQIAIDVSELKETEEKLQQAKKMEAVGILSSGIAHDFNNILGVILGNAELATDSVGSFNPAYENLKEIETATFRAKKLVEQLLDFSSKSSPAKEQLDWCSLVGTMVEFLKTRTPFGVELVENIPQEPLYVMGDEKQLQTVLKNVYANACEAMKSSGTIEISLSALHVDDLGWRPEGYKMNGQWLQLTVNDNGVGMDARIIDKIFDPYFTTHEFGKGSGLGLATVYGIVKNHHGYIMVKSEPGEGSAVSILLPQFNAEAERENSKKEKEIPLPRVLVVDDEPLIAKMLDQMLCRLGYSVSAFTCPMEALKAFAKRPDQFDIILTDMAMPELSGFDLIRKIREMAADVPIVIATGNNAEVGEKEIASLNISGLLTKPAKKKDLAEMLSSCLAT